MITRIHPIFMKEIRQILRDKLSLGVIILIPVFMLIMFGYALNLDVKDISLGLYDEDNSKTSREFINKFTQSEYFTYVYKAKTSKDIDEAIQKRIISVGFIIPKDFSKKIIKGDTATVQILVDGSNSTTASTVLGYINAIISDYSKNILAQKLLYKANLKMPEIIVYKPRIWFNPELKSVKFMVPGLIGFILLISSVIATSLSIVRERERNTIEQIIVSPIRAYELIIGKTITYILIAVITAVLIFIAGYFMFGIEIRGSYLLLSISILIYLIACLGLGLLISTVAETQQVAFMISAMITMLPTFILSGFVFPIRNMPFVVQLVTYVVPARYFMVILRDIVLKGTGIASFWHDLLALVIFAVITLSVSIARIKKVYLR